MAISDVLYEAEMKIREYQRAGVIAAVGDPNLELVLDIMRAERHRPGRDGAPNAADIFTIEATVAFERYRDSVDRPPQ